MSKNAKNSRRIQQAREWSKTRVGGGKGPKVNSAKPGKKTYRTEKDGRPREDRRKAASEFQSKIADRLEKRWGKNIKVPTI
jgi:hypothetical protein